MKYNGLDSTFTAHALQWGWRHNSALATCEHLSTDKYFRLFIRKVQNKRFTTSLMNFGMRIILHKNSTGEYFIQHVGRNSQQKSRVCQVFLLFCQSFQILAFLTENENIWRFRKKFPKIYAAKKETAGPWQKIFSFEIFTNAGFLISLEWNLEKHCFILIFCKKVLSNPTE